TEKEYDIISKKDQQLTQMKAIATYQFGLKLANALTKNSIVKGRYPYLKLFDKNKYQLGMIPNQRGLISLTAEGGKRIIHLQKYIVKIDTGFTVKGSILSPGVLDADASIRKGDDVLVKQGEKFIGVGSAEMNGVEMVQRTYGEAVNMRHKIKN
ncbi:MAG: tRNA-ribosyltransferase, partial [Candidatus Thermoplasmatota archaeon]|nr:tRNA-ribosyltransferase [Candidatus Thermoplasmatota archaeon]